MPILIFVILSRLLGEPIVLACYPFAILVSVFLLKLLADLALKYWAPRPSVGMLRLWLCPVWGRSFMRLCYYIFKVIIWSLRTNRSGVAELSYIMYYSVVVIGFISRDWSTFLGERWLGGWYFAPSKCSEDERIEFEMNSQLSLSFALTLWKRVLTDFYLVGLS